MTMQSNPCLASCGPHLTSPPGDPVKDHPSGSRLLQGGKVGRRPRTNVRTINTLQCAQCTHNARHAGACTRRMFTDKSAARVRKFSSVHRESLSLAVAASHSTLRLPGLRSLSAITNHGCLGLFGSLSLFPTTLKTPIYNQSWMGGLFPGVYPCFSLK